MRSLVNYFINRPVIANALMFGVLFASLIFWQKIGKEEMPEFTFNFVRINIAYPGASAEDVELFITKPIEEKLKGLTSLKEVSSTSSYSTSFINVVFETTVKDLQKKVQDVKDAVNSVDLPKETKNPVYRQFKSSEKAIIDIGMYLNKVEILNVKDRQRLQKYALSFKNKLLTLPEVSGVNIFGYLRPELLVKVKPEFLKKYEISMGQVKSQITSQNIRTPIGSMKDKRETEVSLISELNNIEALKEVIISSGFEGQKLKLNEIAIIEEDFEKANIIRKIQGHEGVIFNIQKSEAVDILSAQKAIMNFIKTFKKNNADAPVDILAMDDESYDVRSRLTLIGKNGAIGFILIAIILFLFLDLRSGIWVAMGIPFSLSITLIISHLFGYTINNMTLASIIIVLGIVVDDAIIVAENIARKFNKQRPESATNAVLQVGKPVVASVLTTCAAFLPLYFFTGKFGLFVKYIPLIIFLMLFASLIESFLILPSHIVHETRFENFLKKYFNSDKLSQRRTNLLQKLENFYSIILLKALKFRGLTILGFIALLLFSIFIFKNNMNYVMFPREESRFFRIKVVGPDGTNRLGMAKLIRKVEDIFLKDGRGIVMSISTTIGQNRRGGEVKESEASIWVEIVPASERDISFNNLIDQWKIQLDNFSDFKEIKFQKNSFGSSKGSPIVLEIQENNDELRAKVTQSLKSELEKLGTLTNIEIEKPITKYQYKLNINKDKAHRLGINYEQLGTTLRSYIQGDILYTINNGDEEVDLRFTSNDKSKNNIKHLLNLRVANSNNYLVPIKNIVTLEEGTKPASIKRTNFKRVTSIYADLAKKQSVTPLEVAQKVENNIIPHLLKGNPSSHIVFRGEVEDSRESGSDFTLSVTLALVIIYLLLVFLFDSFLTPFLIGAIIPFGIVGTILAFWAHGMPHFGFFAVVGSLGMIGVVINDSIVLVDRLNDETKDFDPLNIAAISSSRLRAIIITTVTTVAGLFPTAYGLGGYDSMLAEMMLAMGWGLVFGMFITLFLVPCIYSYYAQFKFKTAKV